LRGSTTRGRELLAAVGLAAVVLSSACSGAPAPVGPSGTTTSKPDGPPAVARPLDAAGSAAAPCDRLLTTDELRTLSISTAGRPRTYSGVSECSWTSGTDDRLRIGVVTTRDLLADTYRSTHAQIFEPTVVGGYPAVRQRTSLRYNTCNVTTGLGGRQALETDWTGSAPPSPSVDPCQRAEEAIALVIGKLPAQKQR
jgi:hypothetical protein